eukprot:CAMPEP_0185556268 /NCGR_PEP_ID=MMETSP1381-20130426/46721_1 /TAXON_ID=298111 /ORGANISM="Pavlova sp., Strain CCMP459" /LENGTH=89 /DNA_ID=CAMNT_0028169641 /DNA_START=1 /DNA_END=267 /DNA_ORIENTATION=+
MVTGEYVVRRRSTYVERTARAHDARIQKPAYSAPARQRNIKRARRAHAKLMGHALHRMHEPQQHPGQSRYPYPQPSLSADSSWLSKQPS